VRIPWDDPSQLALSARRPPTRAVISGTLRV
jgi:hypothetical protein